MSPGDPKEIPDGVRRVVQRDRSAPEVKVKAADVRSAERGASIRFAKFSFDGHHAWTDDAVMALMASSPCSRSMLPDGVRPPVAVVDPLGQK